MDDARIWRKRVADWRASGQTATNYCAARGLSVSRLRYWAYKRPAGKAAAASTSTDRARRPGPALARVVRTGERPAARSDSMAIVLEVCGARVHVGRGFDRETLAQVVELLGAGGAR